MSLRPKEPRPGDLIEFTDKGNKHWAVYEGNGYVVHLANKKLVRFRRWNIVAVVSRELLRYLVENSEYRVNNHLDDKYSPLPVKKILSAMRKKIGEMMVMEFEDWKKKCEVFATYLRYGLISTDWFCDGPKAGDMLEFFRPGYQHWALYEEDGYVIHLAPPDDFMGKESMVYSVVFGQAVVKRQPLKSVADDCPYRINNYLDDCKPPRLERDILRDARKAVGKNLDYSLLYWNCEHFATCLRNKFPFSAQAENFFRRLQLKNVIVISDIEGPVCEEVLRDSMRNSRTYNTCTGVCRLNGLRRIFPTSSSS